MNGDQGILVLCVSPSEAMRCWKKQRKTIMHAIYSGRLIARQSAFGGAWLINTASAIKLWGKPDNEAWKQIVLGAEVGGVGLK